MPIPIRARTFLLLLLAFTALLDLEFQPNRSLFVNAQRQAVSVSSASPSPTPPSRKPGQCPPSCLATISVCGSGSSADLRFLSCICSDTYLAAFDKCASLCLLGSGSGLSGYAVRVRCAQVGFYPPPGEQVIATNATWLGINRPHMALRGPAGNPPPWWYGTTATTASAAATPTADVTGTRLTTSAAKTTSSLTPIVASPAGGSSSASGANAAATTSQGGLPTWALAVICAIGGVAVLIIGLGLFFCLRARRAKKAAAEKKEPEMSVAGSSDGKPPAGAGPSNGPVSPRSPPPSGPSSPAPALTRSSTASPSTRSILRTPTLPPSYSSGSRQAISPVPSYQDIVSNGSGKKRATFDDPSLGILDAYSYPEPQQKPKTKRGDTPTSASSSNRTRDRAVRPVASDSASSARRERMRIDTGVAREPGSQVVATPTSVASTPREYPGTPREYVPLTGSPVPSSLDHVPMYPMPSPAPRDTVASPTPSREYGAPRSQVSRSGTRTPTSPLAQSPTTLTSIGMPPPTPTAVSRPPLPPTPAALPPSGPIPDPTQAAAALGLARPVPMSRPAPASLPPTPTGERMASFQELQTRFQQMEFNSRASEDSGETAAVGTGTGGSDKGSEGTVGRGSSGTVYA